MGDEEKETFGCETCKLRQRAEIKPKSLLARFWRWHTRWCPGWKKYMASLTEEERAAIKKRYGLR